MESCATCIMSFRAQNRVLSEESDCGLLHRVTIGLKSGEKLCQVYTFSIL